MFEQALVDVRRMPYRAIVAGLLLLGLCDASIAQEENETLFTIKALRLESALELAQAGLADCRKRDYQVAVAVVDRFGNTQVMLRDRFAGPHTPETAARKAWTAVSFRTDSLSLSELTRSGASASGIRHIGNALMVGGGRTVEAEGSIVAGIGVSGGPSGKADDLCAQAAIEALTEQLM